MAQTNTTAFVSSLHVYPVKALHGLDYQSLTLHTWGAEHDRRWLVTEPDGTFLTQRALPAMACLHATPVPQGLRLERTGTQACTVPYPAPNTPTHAVRVWKDTIQAQDAGEDAAQWLSTQLGRPCRLVYMASPEHARLRAIAQTPVPVSFADGYPLLLATTASLADLNQRLEHPVPMARFRPNIVIANNQPWAEDTWRVLKIGTALLRIVAPCSRCTVTTTDQETGLIPNRKEPLATLAQFHRTPKGIMFAQNTLVEQTGTIQIGDEVEFLETGPSNLSI
ncbi:MOSC domain-containing protein [Acetobacter orientalis]|uniref:MOSC domain-containing protein n=1 Tax=Acetobacter orientalis TaxID=146474 RepID=UPI0039EA3AA8